ncbi:hypothetical protein A2U01_0048159 [Trifolium medium]|uniref:Uncharacterized protein n=1 Tax=Trifolium medium TaxID=97028 RepID=A0A392QRE3_9FABA|nr:hypothetical protein [Trifolium medium]
MARRRASWWRGTDADPDGGRRSQKFAMAKTVPGGGSRRVLSEGFGMGLLHFSGRTRD